jgi:hypothetical protein
MRSILSLNIAFAFLCICLLAHSQQSFGGSNEELTPEKLVAEHVKSVGRPALLAKIQSRTFLGASNFEFIQGMNGGKKGTAMFVSQGPKLAMVMKYDDINYPGEYFAYDGKDVTVGHMSPGQRSPVGDFIFRFNKLVKGGFLGGALTSSWPLLDVKGKNVDMKYRKTKVEGRELHELEYHPRSGFGDIKIRMYFDLTTFRHVRTEYKVRTSGDASFRGDKVAGGGSSSATQMTGDIAPDDEGVRSTVDAYGNAPSSSTPGIGQSTPDSYYTLVEKFEDYKREGGLMLPHRYVMEYSAEGSGVPFIGRWFVNIANWSFNVPNLDQKLFKALK